MLAETAKRLLKEQEFADQWNSSLPPIKWKVLNKTTWVADTPRSRKKEAGEPSYAIERDRGIIT